MTQILKFLESEEMHITHYGLGMKGTLALVGALEVRVHSCMACKQAGRTRSSGMHFLCVPSSELRELERHGLMLG